MDMRLIFGFGFVLLTTVNGLQTRVVTNRYEFKMLDNPNKGNKREEKINPSDDFIQFTERTVYDIQDAMETAFVCAIAVMIPLLIASIKWPKLTRSFFYCALVINLLDFSLRLPDILYGGV